MVQPQQGVLPETESQAIKEELGLARKKIERYEHLGTASSSSAGRISSPTPLWRRVFGKVRPPQGKTRSGSPQTPIFRIAETSDVPSSPTKRDSPEPTFKPPPGPQIVAVDNIPESSVDRPNKANWSVVHNQEVKQTMNVHLAHTLEMKSRVLCVKFSRQGEYLAVGLANGETCVYDTKILSNRVLVEYPEKNKLPIWAIQFSLDDKYFAIGGSDGRIKVWNIAERRIVAMFKGHKHTVFSLDLSPDGRFLVSGSFDSSIRIWCMRDGSSRRLNTPMSLVTSVAFSPDGRYVAAADTDGMLRIWNFRNGELLEEWNAKGHVHRLWSMVFTSDGKGLLSGGQDDVMRCWDISSLTAGRLVSRRFGVDGGNMDEENEVLAFQQHTQAIYSISTLPDSRWVVSGSQDCNICIWDARTCAWHWTLKGHQEVVTSIDASCDGCHLASGSEDCLVRIWRYEQA